MVLCNYALSKLYTHEIFTIVYTMPCFYFTRLTLRKRIAVNGRNTIVRTHAHNFDVLLIILYHCNIKKISSSNFKTNHDTSPSNYTTPYGKKRMLVYVVNLFHFLIIRNVQKHRETPFTLRL